MPGQPFLLSNRHRPDAGDDSHAAALAYLLDHEAPSEPLAVATGFVNLGGLEHLAAVASDGRPVRLMLGAAPDPGLGAELPDARFADQLRLLAGERDFARFPPSRAARRLAAVDAWLAREGVEVRRYTHRFLHGKAYLIGTAAHGRAALVTSANLTGAGLHANLELGLVHYGAPAAPLAVRWFDALWSDAAGFTEELRDLLFPQPGRVDPETVYLRALLELYGAELEATEVEAPRSRLELADFQRDGFERARSIVARHGGVIYADGVGTGKTEVGLAFVEEYAVRRGAHALVVAPAQLVPAWQARIHRERLPAQVVSFGQLASDEQLAPWAAHPRRHLANARDTYRLVVVDEAHALRNPDTTWYRAMERLLGGEPKDLVLLTATPVNNGLWDLFHLVMLFARHDRALAEAGIPSVRRLFVRAGAGAGASDPESLDPDVLFPLADSVSVRRDRRFIEAEYPDATFPDGTPVRFPTPTLATVRYDLDAHHPGLVAEVAAAIDALTMARYRPSAYRREGGEAAEEATLAGLLRSGVLKRFESCWRTCLRSVERMSAAHQAFLAGWDAGAVPSSRPLREAAAESLDEAGVARWALEELPLDDEAEPVSAFRGEYRDDVAGDLDRLRELCEALAALERLPDPKLARLREVLRDSPARKVAVFTTFGETVRYLEEHLGDVGRAAVTVIGTETDPDERTRRLARFCPDTVVEAGYDPPGGEADLLISTDVLSEGQNLQQAQAVVSYDMPWNPQRVVQRNGRVIRLKSPHREVLLTTMLPEEGELELLLGLEARIRAKVRAADVFGMESEVIEGIHRIDEELRSFAGRLAGGDVSLLEEDGGPGAGTFVGEELRARLARAAREGELRRLEGLPWGIGAGFRQGAGVPSRGAAGAFFACRTPGGERHWRYVERGGEVIGDDLELLRRIDPGDAPGEDGPFDLEAAWAAAAASIVAEQNARADPRGTGLSPGPAQLFALELLRDQDMAHGVGTEQAEAALRVERGSGLRRAIGEIRAALGAGVLTRAEAAARVVSLVEERGLRPVPDPPTPEPITADDLGVVCWMLVMPAGS